MNTWNYRIMVNGDGHFSIREVFYGDNKDIEGWTDECSPFGETLDELTNDINYMMQAFQRDILIESEIMTNIVDTFKEELGNIGDANDGQQND